MKPHPMVIRQLVISTMICVSCDTGVCSVAEAKSEDYARLSVFYATDREAKVFPRKNKYYFGKQTDPSSSSNLIYGIENFKTRIPAELSLKGNWRSAFTLDIFGDEHEPRGMKFRTFKGVTYGYVYGADQKEQFFGQLSGCLSKCPTNELVVFIHGCCVDHQQAVRQTANLQKWFKRPVILYDWGTVSKVYYQSLLAYPRTQDRFKGFVSELKRRYPDTKITLIAYSVGSNILKDFCLSTDQGVTKQFENVIVLRGDTSVKALEEALPAVVKQSVNPVQIWVSSNDSQMIASRLLRTITRLPAKVVSLKGPRAGETMAWKEKKFEGVDVFDVSHLGLGHEIPYKLIPVYGRSSLREGENGEYKLTRLENHVFEIKKH